MITTWKFRIKDGGAAKTTLKRMSRSVNFVWNFSKQTQREALNARSARIIKDKATGKDIGIPNFLSSSELDKLVAGSSKELGLHSQTVQAVTQEYSTRRIQFKKLLRWRGKIRTAGFRLKLQASNGIAAPSLIVGINIAIGTHEICQLMQKSNVEILIKMRAGGGTFLSHLNPRRLRS